MTPTPLILASSSPRRQQLLSELGLRFDVIKPDLDESIHPGEDPITYAQRLSQEKAAIVARQVTGEQAILAADTVVILAADTIGVSGSGALLAKPANSDDARRMLRSLRNRDHQVCTAFTLQRTGTDPRTHTEAVRTIVTMRNYSDDEIEAYIATGDPFDKAGSYAIQHPTFAPVAAIQGSYSNVVGLPVDEVKAALMAFGLL